MSSAVFASVLGRLQRSDGWASSSTELTTDIIHRSGTRGTVRGRGIEPTFLIKEASEAKVDLEVASSSSSRAPAGATVAMRLSCSSERSMPMPGAQDPPELFRLKTRHSFNRKQEFLYELTEVRSGPSMELAAAAAPVFEVELEWCGQAAAKACPGGPALLRDKFLAKLQDICNMVAEAREAEAQRAAAARKDKAAASSAASSAASAAAGGSSSGAAAAAAAASSSSR